MSESLNPILEKVAGDLAASIMKHIRAIGPQFDSPWMKEATAAEYLCMKQRGLQNHRRQGTGPRYCLPGGVIRYHRDDLDDYMRSGEIVPGAGS